MQLLDSLGVTSHENQPLMVNLLERGISSQPKLLTPKSEEKEDQKKSSSQKVEEKEDQKRSPSHRADDKEKFNPQNDKSQPNKPSPIEKESPSEKQSHSSERQSHSQSLKPVSNSRHRKGHLENDPFADSDLEASTSSVSSITSIGSGNSKVIKGFVLFLFLSNLSEFPLPDLHRSAHSEVMRKEAKIPWAIFQMQVLVDLNI